MHDEVDAAGAVACGGRRARQGAGMAGLSSVAGKVIVKWFARRRWPVAAVALAVVVGAVALGWWRLASRTAPRAVPAPVAAATVDASALPSDSASPTATPSATPPPTPAAAPVRAAPPPPGPPSAPAHPPAAPAPVDVPWQHQVYNLACEESSLSMVEAYFGRTVSDQDVLTFIGVDQAHYWTGAGGGDPFVDFVGDPNGSEVRNTGYGVYWPPIRAAG